MKTPREYIVEVTTPDRTLVFDGQHRTQEQAQAIADQATAIAKRHGWRLRYRVRRVLPSAERF